MNSYGSYKAFVSSTYDDLKDHRAHVIRELRKAGFFVDPMEDWTAAADAPKEFSRRRLEGCHLCILLVARRRGHVPGGETQSITQLEYEEAIRQGIDILPWFLDESIPEEDWPWEDRETIEAWRKEIYETNGAGSFRKTPTTIDIAPALTRWVTEQGPPALPGSRQAGARLHSFCQPAPAAGQRKCADQSALCGARRR